MWRNRGFIWAWTTKVWQQNQQLHRRSDTRSLMTFSRVPCGDHSPRERKRPGSYLGKSWICRSRQFSRTVPARSTSLSPVLCHFSSCSGRHLSVRVWIFSRNADCCYLTVPTWYWPSMFNIFLYIHTYIYIWVSPLHMSWPFIKAFEFIRLSYIHQFFQEEDAPAEASEDHEDWNVLRAQVSPERNMVLECDDMLQCLPKHGTEIAGHIRGTRPPGNEKRSDVSTYTFQRKVAGAPDAKSIGEHLHVYLWLPIHLGCQVVSCSHILENIRGPQGPCTVYFALVLETLSKDATRSRQQALKCECRGHFQLLPGVHWLGVDWAWILLCHPIPISVQLLGNAFPAAKTSAIAAPGAIRWGPGLGEEACEPQRLSTDTGKTLLPAPHVCKICISLIPQTAHPHWGFLQ